MEQYFQLKYMQAMTGIILVLGVMLVSIIAFLYVIYKTKKEVGDTGCFYLLFI